MNFQDLFKLGMKRQLPELLTCEGPAFDCGASGRYVAPGAVPLGPPDWLIPIDAIPAKDGTVATIHAYHFLEHLTGDEAVFFLREVERVLIPERGVMNFSIPYYHTVLAAQSLEHKSLWCEETFPKLFEEDTFEYYGKWRLRVHFLMIAGIVSRNLALVGQLVSKRE
jgi:hypothetical protein